MYVFVLQHAHTLPQNEEAVKMIGVYSTENKAKEAIERLQLQPGFCDTPQGFSIDRYLIDEDNWKEGYTTYYYSSKE